MKKAGDCHRGEVSAEPITRSELLAMLRAARLGISDHTLRHYQALGFIPAPRAYGRPGQSKGVTWGWARGEADRIIDRVRIIRTHQRKGTRLVRILADDPELSEVFETLIEEAREEARARGYEQGYEDGQSELLDHAERDEPHGDEGAELNGSS